VKPNITKSYTTGSSIDRFTARETMRYAFKEADPSGGGRREPEVSRGARKWKLVGGAERRCREGAPGDM